MREFMVALAGNQNSGKTTLFNRLTGSNQHVGNFPGVTVEKKQGVVKQFANANLIDLPGIYSLSPYTSEEVVTRDFIIKEKVDLLINIIDATNIERNLYLTLQLMELNTPMIIALNMMDEVKANGNSIDIDKLSERLKIPIVAISASKNQGIHELILKMKETIMQKSMAMNFDFCSGEVHRAIHSIAHIIEDHAHDIQVPVRFAATKLVEGDSIMEQSLSLHQDDVEIIKKIVQSMEKALHTDREAALADMRYTYIVELMQACVNKTNESFGQIRSNKIDTLLTHKYLGIPIFILLMFGIFYLTFVPIGGTLQGFMEEGIAFITNGLSIFLLEMNINPVLHSLVIDGICNGIGSVLSFLPIIVVLFCFLSLLEDSGYMARVAFVMDKALRRIGLSGKSFVPMLIGFGCSVPAIMSTRTLSAQRDRKLTIIITPFMSCSAKLPIYGMMCAAFFPNHSAIIMISLYLLGIFVSILCAFILKKTAFKGESVPFVLELPTYRIPSAKSTLLHMWEKAKDFLKRAFTIIFIASLLIWFLQSFNFQLQLVKDSSDSILASLGNLMAVIFRPLGFHDWRAASALVTGISAKESVVSTLSVLLKANNDLHLYQALQQIFTPLSAYAFLCFILLYMPCIAAFAATRRELNSMRQAILTVVFQSGVAYVVACLFYQIGRLFL